MSTTPRKARNICFTLNNFSEDELQSLRTSELRYMVFQREVGTNGTPHIQGFAIAQNAKSLESWKRCIGARAHIEFARGSIDQNIGYCTKEDTRVAGTEPETYGEKPVQGSRSDLSAVAVRVREGARMEELASEFTSDFVRYSNGIAKLAGLFGPVRNHKTAVFWFYGPTGSGKSHEASDMAPAAYWKMGSSKWWDGYDSHEDVIIDDYRRDLCTFAELLRLFDRYPMRVEFKGGTCNFVAKRVFVTTPKPPRDTWEGRTEEDLQQLLRRIETVKYFPGTAGQESGTAEESGTGGQESGISSRNPGTVVQSSVFGETTEERRRRLGVSGDPGIDSQV